MLKSLPTLLLAMTLSVGAFADRNKSVEELLEIMNMSEAMAGSIDQMVQVELQNNPALAPYQQVMTQFFQKHLSYEQLKDEFVSIYADAFTADEVADMIAFYKTSTGQKTIELMPMLMAKGAQVGQAKVQDNLPELQSMIAEESQRIQALQAE